MECLIGIQCKDFVLVAADMTTTQSIIVMKSGKRFVTIY
jgi:20S proteasome subunit beta 4